MAVPVLARLRPGFFAVGLLAVLVATWPHALVVAGGSARWKDSTNGCIQQAGCRYRGLRGLRVQDTHRDLDRPLDCCQRCKAVGPAKCTHWQFHSGNGTCLLLTQREDLTGTLCKPQFPRPPQPADESIFCGVRKNAPAEFGIRYVSEELHAYEKPTADPVECGKRCNARLLCDDSGVDAWTWSQSGGNCTCLAGFGDHASAEFAEDPDAVSGSVEGSINRCQPAEQRRLLNRAFAFNQGMPDSTLWATAMLDNKVAWGEGSGGVVGPHAVGQQGASSATASSSPALPAYSADHCRAQCVAACDCKYWTFDSRPMQQEGGRVASGGQQLQQQAEAEAAVGQCWLLNQYAWQATPLEGAESGIHDSHALKFSAVDPVDVAAALMPGVSQPPPLTYALSNVAGDVPLVQDVRNYTTNTSELALVATLYQGFVEMGDLKIQVPSYINLEAASIPSVRLASPLLEFGGQQRVLQPVDISLDMSNVDVQVAPRTAVQVELGTRTSRLDLYLYLLYNVSLACTPPMPSLPGYEYIDALLEGVDDICTCPDEPLSASELRLALHAGGFCGSVVRVWPDGTLLVGIEANFGVSEIPVEVKSANTSQELKGGTTVNGCTCRDFWTAPLASGQQSSSAGGCLALSGPFGSTPWCQVYEDTCPGAAMEMDGVGAVDACVPVARTQRGCTCASFYSYKAEGGAPYQSAGGCVLAGREAPWCYVDAQRGCSEADLAQLSRDSSAAPYDSCDTDSGNAGCDILVGALPASLEPLQGHEEPLPTGTVQECCARCATRRGCAAFAFDSGLCRIGRSFDGTEGAANASALGGINRAAVAVAKGEAGDSRRRRALAEGLDLVYPVLYGMAKGGSLAGIPEAARGNTTWQQVCCFNAGLGNCLSVNVSRSVLIPSPDSGVPEDCQQAKDSYEPDTGSSSTGLIIGVSVGCAVGIPLLLAALWLLLRCLRTRRLQRELHERLRDLQVPPRLYGSPVLEGGKYAWSGAADGGEGTTFLHGVVAASRRPVLAKFVDDDGALGREARFYHEGVAQAYIPELLDAHPRKEGSSCPGCLVMARGEYSLHELLHVNNQDISLQGRRTVLRDVAEALHALHQRQLQHGDLKPHNFVFFASAYRWCLIDFACYAHFGDRVQPSMTLHYAAPEVLRAAESGKHLVAGPAADMWSLGAVAWELFMGAPLFSDDMAEDDVKLVLRGKAPLPFEEDPGAWGRCPDRQVQDMVRGLLQRDPTRRMGSWELQKKLQSSHYTTMLKEVNMKVADLTQRVSTLHEVTGDVISSTLRRLVVVDETFEKVTELYPRRLSVADSVGSMFGPGGGPGGGQNGGGMAGLRRRRPAAQKVARDRPGNADGSSEGSGRRSLERLSSGDSGSLVDAAAFHAAESVAASEGWRSVAADEDKHEDDDYDDVADDSGNPHGDGLRETQLRYECYALGHCRTERAPTSLGGLVSGEVTLMMHVNGLYAIRLDISAGEAGEAVDLPICGVEAIVVTPEGAEDDSVQLLVQGMDSGKPGVWSGFALWDLSEHCSQQMCEPSRRPCAVTLTIALRAKQPLSEAAASAGDMPVVHVQKRVLLKLHIPGQVFQLERGIEGAMGLWEQRPAWVRHAQGTLSTAYEWYQAAQQIGGMVGLT